MAIPVYLQQFKAAGIYRVVFDKSTVAGVDSEVLRLVVGYSEKGPFNIPTYITSVSDFKSIYGDVSKKLEKRGVYFHRLAIQALAAGPILCLNLKKFDGETVDGATINSDFNPSYAPIDTVKLAIEDIYDTKRFWELDAEKLNDLKAIDGSVMDQYINICATNTKDCSATYFIRKASGTKVNGYNLTISDWYSDGAEELPEYLKSYQNSLVSDFFAEIYVFKGHFSAAQVLASSTLKNYFEMVDGAGTEDEPVIKLRPYVTNAYGDAVDTLDTLYNDETSNAIGHYIGCLIPGFMNKQGQHASLDVIFNSDQNVHNLMLSFNTDLLDEDENTGAHIDLSGRLSVPTTEAISSQVVTDNGLSIASLKAGNAVTTLLGNEKAPVISDVLTISNNVVKRDTAGQLIPFIALSQDAKKIMGTLYVNKVDEKITKTITLGQVGSTDTVTIDCGDDEARVWSIAHKLGAAFVVTKEEDADYTDVKTGTSYKLHKSGYGTLWTSGSPFITDQGEFTVAGPQYVITTVARIELTTKADEKSAMYSDTDLNMKVSTTQVITSTISSASTNAVYGSSVSFIPVSASSNWEEDTVDGCAALVCRKIYDNSLYSLLSVGDCFLADDGSTDRDNDGEDDSIDFFYDNVYVQDLYTENDKFGNIVKYVIKFSGTPMIDDDYLIRIDSALNQEVGTMIPQYLEGYTYKNSKPADTGMAAKLEWQKFILSALTEYKGLRTGLLNKADVDYRYIVDTFETYVDSEVKNIFSYLAKEKQSAFAFLNFPAVKTFIKCPYTSFTDSDGIFRVEYVVKGFNKKKPTNVQFSLPSDSNGASFCAFYTPVKLSDGYVDTIIPSAALVSNLFMTKYTSRQPYYIVAGPNYANVKTSNLVGPDYTYSQDELQIIEPFGVNCMVYRPKFGTFINANQTAKQTPVSALSKVNVRELVIYLQDEIEKVLQAYQWEFNNPTTRQAILAKANTICARVAANGGIQAYLNVMDESNNGPEIIDNEMAVLSTHIEPGMGCGKMVQELTLYRTGQMAATILE